MGRIEKRKAGLARSTDGSGAKFMRPHQQQLWREALSDPVIADQPVVEGGGATILYAPMIARLRSASILMTGAWQYGIQGGMLAAMSRIWPIATSASFGQLQEDALEDAIADGQSVMDMGAGRT